MSNPPKQPNKTERAGLDLIAAKPPETAAADAAFEDEKHQLDLERLKLENEEARGTIQDRRRYAEKVYRLVGAWIVLIFVLLILQGFGSFYSFKLSDPVLLAAIGSTTVNVIGMLLIVLRYLFPSSEKPKK